MDRRLQAAVERQVGTKVPGLALVAVQAGRVVLSEAWGLADVSSGTPMRPETACNWFSMTKLATATVTVQLADQRCLDLDAPVRQYYEPFAVTRPEVWSKAATVRDLLSHASGLTNPLPMRWVHLANESGPNRARFVQTQLEKHRRLRFDPGTKAAYSNLGYLVLGEVIEAASGMPFDKCVDENLLTPLGMRHTGFTVAPDESWATPYQRRRTVLNTLLPALIPRRIIGQNEGRFRSFNHFYVDGASYGGLVGPTVDVARFLGAHLEDGEWNGTRVLTAESARSMRTITTHGKRLRVGLGWYQRDENPDPDTGVVEHLGGGAGFWTFMRIYPERNIGIAMMGNSTSYDHNAIASAALTYLVTEELC